MKNSNAGFHLGNLIKKHIYFRNKSVKEVAMHLDLNEKTFSDHLNKSKMLSDELFDIADYLELSLDYLGSMSKNKPGLLGQKVCRLNKTSHNKANELVSCEIKKIKSTDWSVISNIKENRITLITCIKNNPKLRLCVQGVESPNDA